MKSVLRTVILGLTAAAALSLMVGCAGPRALTSEVSSAGKWPDGRKPGRYVFERLPSQQSQPDLQGKLEAAAQPVLAAAGFEHVDKAEQADVSVQVASQVHVEQRYYGDPFWPYGPYGPWRPGFGAGWWGGRGGVSMSMSMEPARISMNVDVLIRDLKAGQVLYETHARYERLGAADDRLYPYLFEAALKDFPHQAVSPRTVTIEIPEDQR
jgi:hypothetical protein